MSNLTKDNLIIAVEELCCNVYRLRSALKDIYETAERQPPEVLKKIQEICEIAVENSMVGMVKNNCTFEEQGERYEN